MLVVSGYKIVTNKTDTLTSATLTLVGDDERGRITKLEVLDVSNCYQIDEYLPELYELYIHNPVVKIYIETSYDTDSNAYWNPYEELLPIYLSEIPSVLTFGMVNQ